VSFSVGLDIGGANIKAAHTSGAAVLQPFELWKKPADLSGVLAAVLAQLPAPDQLAVTMTGELCDCFSNKREGVAAILAAVESVAGSRPVRVWQIDGRFVEPQIARGRPFETASANWHALATYAGRLAPAGPALLVDIGSTTTDIVPLADGKPAPRGRTDPERLRSGELLYTGVRRTPLCSLLGPDCAAELFATTGDVYLILGKAAQDANDCTTADGRPATREFAELRLARMLCADLETCTENDRRNLALRVANRQAFLIRQALEKHARNCPGPLAGIILAGSGEFLARAALDFPLDVPGRLPAAVQVISLNHKHGTAISQAACAYALAVLASEQHD
jgi:hypothetical protein